jgi:hypothetical protein
LVVAGQDKLQDRPARVEQPYGDELQRVLAGTGGLNSSANNCSNLLIWLKRGAVQLQC